MEKMSTNNLPNDCIGEIALYNDKSKIASNLLLLSKELKKFFENKNFECFKHVEYNFFWPNYLRKRKQPLNYVSKITVDFMRQEKLKVKDSSFKLFPKLKYLRINCTSKLTDKLFKHVPNLETLDIEECNKVGDKGFRFLKKLQTLKVDNCQYKFNKFKLSDKCLQYLKSLKKLEISGNVAFKCDGFKNIPNIETLKFYQISDQLNDSIFESTPNVLKLEIIRCGGFKEAGFRNLKKIKQIECDNCIHITNKLPSMLTVKDVKVKIKEFLPMKGDVAPELYSDDEYDEPMDE